MHPVRRLSRAWDIIHTCAPFVSCLSLHVLLQAEEVPGPVEAAVADDFVYQQLSREEVQVLTAAYNAEQVRYTGSRG